MIREEVQEFANAWDVEPEKSPAPAPDMNDPIEQGWADEAPAESMATRLANGEKLAAGDGVSMRSHEGMKEAGVGPYDGTAVAKPKPAPVDPPKIPESDSDKAWKERNALKQWDEGYAKFKKHGVSHAEAMKRLGPRPAEKKAESVMGQRM